MKRFNNTVLQIKKKFTARKNGRWIVIAGYPYNNPTSADFQDQFVRVSFPPIKFVILGTFVSFSHLWWFQWKFLKLTGAIDTTEREKPKYFWILTISMKNKIIITFFIIFWMSFLERDMNGEFSKESRMYFSEIFTDRVIFRRTCPSWSAESTNLGTFLKAWIAFFFFLKSFLKRVWRTNSKKKS